MMGNWYNWSGMMGNWSGYGFRSGLGLLLLWSLVWKALALWRAAREDSKPWFGAILILNTAGILEIIYLFFFAKEKLNLSSLSAKPTSKKKSKKF